jgi:F-type H+-transporting ATPase subunit g
MLRSSLRPQRLRRSFHTTRFSAADAKETASRAAESAKQTASKATASAQEYASKALEQSQKLAKAIGNTGEKLLQNAGPRVNGLVDRVAGLQKPIVYWGKVSGEVAKQGIPHFGVTQLVYLKEKMSPPSSAQFQETFDALRKQVAKPEEVFKKAMEYTDINKVRGLGWQPFARAGLRGLELFGFFCIGEMIGRRSIKGYNV